MMITKKNIKKHELIGLETFVLESGNKTQEKIKGKVVNETQKTLKIETSNGEKIVAKKGSIFRFKIPKGTVNVNGDDINMKPEERVRKG